MRVRTLFGQAFFVDNTGMTHALKSGQEISPGSQIMTTVDGQVALYDYHNVQYFISNGAHLKIGDGQIVLVRGYLWLKNLENNLDHKVEITSANSLVQFSSGEGVVSFDPVDGKTQVLVLSGQVGLSNLKTPHFAQSVRSGEFSYVTRDYENGNPRSPTPVGKGTFNKISELFSKVKSTPASQMEEKKQLAAKSPSSKSKGSILRLNRSKVYEEMRPGLSRLAGDLLSGSSSSATSSGRSPASTFEHSSKQMKKSSRKSGAKVRVFGKKLSGKTKAVRKNQNAQNSGRVIRFSSIPKALGGKSLKKVFTPKRRPTLVPPASRSGGRAPASLAPAAPSRAPSRVPVDPFEKALRKAKKTQSRHSDETNQLINELKSFDRDYKKDY